MQKKNRLLLLGFLSLQGCSSFSPEPIESNDAIKGPGLLTGPTGKYTISIPSFRRIEAEKTSETSGKESTEEPHKKE